MAVKKLCSKKSFKTFLYFQDTIQANARFFDGDLTQVPKQALTVGVGTVMDAREVLILITGAHKAYALYKVTLVVLCRSNQDSWKPLRFFREPLGTGFS